MSISCASQTVLQYKGDDTLCCIGAARALMKECLEGLIILCNESCEVLVILKQQQDLWVRANFAFLVSPFCVHLRRYWETTHAFPITIIMSIFIIGSFKNNYKLQRNNSCVSFAFCSLILQKLFQRYFSDGCAMRNMFNVRRMNAHKVDDIDIALTLLTLQSIS